MPSEPSCSRCGARLLSDTPEGLCPPCRALTSPGDGSTAVGASVLETLSVGLGSVPYVRLRDDTAPVTEPQPRAGSGDSEIVGSADSPPRLRLFGEIARGGMGAVLKGRDADLGRDLAVKVLLESHSGKPELVRRFVEEAQIGGQLQHPGVVPVYELGSFPDRRPFFTMKLVKGRTLAELIRSRSGVGDDLPRFLNIFESICQTMAYAQRGA